MARKFKRKVVSFQSFKNSSGLIKDETPCPFFDDCPDVVSPREMVLKLLAGGQAQDFARRQVYYDKEEFEDYKAEYGCDYIQQYKDYLELKKSQSFFRNKESGESENSDDKVAKTGDERSKEPVQASASSVVSTPPQSNSATV